MEQTVREKPPTTTITTTEPLRVYVAGPYTAETEQECEQNVARAERAGIIVQQKGHYPFIPHLSHYAEQRANEMGIEIGYEEFMEWDGAFLEVCDVLLYLNPSPGADREVEHAKEEGILVIESTEQLPEV